MILTEAEPSRGMILSTEAEAEPREKSPFLGQTEAEAEASVGHCMYNVYNIYLGAPHSAPKYRVSSALHNVHVIHVIVVGGSGFTPDTLTKHV